MWEFPAGMAEVSRKGLSTVQQSNLGLLKDLFLKKFRII
jgi:hypothetical protein